MMELEKVVSHLGLPPGTALARPAPEQSFEENWFTMIKTSLKGLFVIDTYNNSGRLNQKARNYLVDMIVNLEMTKSPEEKIPHWRFDQLSDEIIYHFPNEQKDLYYVPYSKIGDKKTSARGKLVDKYWNIRRLKVKPRRMVLT